MAAEPSFLFLGDDVLLNIFSLLSAEEITPLRKSCRYLSSISHARYLWNRLLQRDVVRPGKALPWYRKPHNVLGSRPLELLTRHALRVDSPSVHHVINRFDQTRQSISWLRLIHGRWLLVASRDVKTKINMLNMYSVASVQAGKPVVLFSTELAGPVSSGEVEVQEDQLVIALCFQVPERMVVVMSVRRQANAMGFHKIQRFPGLSHVKCLRKDFVGCAIQGEVSSPCLANWRTGEVITLPCLDKDTRCLSMTVRDDVCCVVTSDSILHLYSLPANGESTRVQVLPLGHAVESVAMSKAAEALPAEHTGDEGAQEGAFRLFITNKTGLYVYDVSRQTPGSFSAEVVAEQEEPAGSSNSRSSRPVHPCFGGSSSRVSWICPPASLFGGQSRLVTAQIHKSSSGASSCPDKLSVLFESKSTQLPSLSALPVMDFDDGAGLLAIGNGFGQLALYSFGGVFPENYDQCLQAIPVPVLA